MGFFSWKTADTNETIWNRYAIEVNPAHQCKPVYLLQPNGMAPILEPSYEGYGDFGGIDALEWLAEMNGKGKDRSEGIELMHGVPGKDKPEPPRFPLKFSFDRNAVYEDLPASPDDDNQGFFDWS